MKQTNVAAVTAAVKDKLFLLTNFEIMHILRYIIDFYKDCDGEKYGFNQSQRGNIVG